VLIAGSGAPGKMALTVEVLTPGAEPATSSEAAAEADVAILASRWASPRNPAAGLRNRLVIDTMEYWWKVDGTARTPPIRRPPRARLCRGIFPGPGGSRRSTTWATTISKTGPAQGNARTQGHRHRRRHPGRPHRRRRLVDVVGFDPSRRGLSRKAYGSNGAPTFRPDVGATELHATLLRLPESRQGRAVTIARSAVATEHAARPSARAGPAAMDRRVDMSSTFGYFW
jgi:hypothetical protein